MKYLLNIAFLLFFSIGYSQIISDTIKLESIEDTKELFSNSDTLLLKKSEVCGGKIESKKFKYIKKKLSY